MLVKIAIKSHLICSRNVLTFVNLILSKDYLMLKIYLISFVCCLYYYSYHFVDADVLGVPNSVANFDEMPNKYEIGQIHVLRWE